MRRIITTSAVFLMLFAAGAPALAQTGINGPRPPANLQFPDIPVNILSPDTGTGAVNAGQTTPSNPLLIGLSPSTPQPNSMVAVQVKTGFLDLTQATVGWLENGKLAESGLGKTSHLVLVGPVGSSITVTAIVTLTDGTVYQKSATIRPASVDIIWEAPTTVPPFYRGKALYSRLGTIRLTALANLIDTNGAVIPSDQLNYQWSLNGEVLGNLSGYGKSLLVYTDPIYQMPSVFSVTVTTADKSLGGSGIAAVNPTQPSIYLYENNPLYGILFNNAIGGSYNLTAQEAAIETYPLFFNVNNRANLSYQWIVNNQVVNGAQGPSLTLRNVSSRTGVASVSLQVSNPLHIAEGGTKDFIVGFGSSQ